MNRDAASQGGRHAARPTGAAPLTYNSLLKGIASVRPLRRSSPEYQALYRIQEGSEKFNSWRKDRNKTYIDLGGIHFKGLDLSGIDFYAVKLKNCIFEETNLTGGNFWGANLNSARFIHCALDRCDFSQARLANTNFSGNDLTNTVLFETIRDNWLVTGVRCEKCWITKSRRASPDTPDVFAPGEFEVCYGGQRFKILFPGGIKPIDLLALPFYVRKLLDTERDKSLIFTGLSTVGEAGLEFRLERCEENVITIARARATFQSVVETGRQEAERLYLELVKQKDSVIANQAQLLSAVIPLIGSKENVINNIATDTFIINRGDTYNINQSGAKHAIAASGGVATIHTQEKIVIESAAEFEQLARELNLLIEAIKTRVTSDRESETIDDLVAARNAAVRQDLPTTLSWLKKAGMWTFGLAEKIGASLAAAALKTALGI